MDTNNNSGVNLNLLLVNNIVNSGKCDNLTAEEHISRRLR